MSIWIRLAVWLVPPYLVIFISALHPHLEDGHVRFRLARIDLFRSILACIPIVGLAVLFCCLADLLFHYERALLVTRKRKALR